MKVVAFATVVAPAATLLILASNAVAQVSGPNSGMFGSPGSSFSGAGIGTNALGVGNSPIGGLGSGSGGSAFGSGLQGIGAQGLGGGFQGFGGGAQGIGGQGLGFGGGQGAQASGFIGRSGADVQSFFQALNPMANQGMGTQVQRTTMNRGREANQTEDVRPPIQVRVSVGFDVPARAGLATRNDGTAGRLNAILERRGFTGANIGISEGVAVVSGAPADASERLVIERLVRLEPGVRRVAFAEELGPEMLEPTPQESDR